MKVLLLCALLFAVAIASPTRTFQSPHRKVPVFPPTSPPSVSPSTEPPLVTITTQRVLDVTLPCSEVGCAPDQICDIKLQKCVTKAAGIP
ncbi:hypothetical protein CHUAL_003896 [Chamberlinius hualienensis]